MGALYALDRGAVNLFFLFSKILFSVVENCPGLWYNTWKFR